MRAWCEEKIANGEIHACLFVVHLDSPIAQMYNFKVREKDSEEEKKLACDHDTSLQEEETWIGRQYSEIGLLCKIPSI